jgi:iron complex outermembrane recepter protein
MGFHKNQRDKLFKKSLLALCIMAVTSPSFAQDDVEEAEEVVVTGMRSDLQDAQEIKRNSDTFVDAISAEDIGSLPDRSVLEAMSRIPGVSIERFAAANDPDHKGVEGSAAVIRGMSQTRSEFNGRDSFTANSGRGLSFQDVPPELMAGVDVYKNQTADMIEGGIAGTVSLRTRKPFDQDGRVFSVSADATYADMTQELTPTVSMLFSDRWESSAGEFGILFNASDSNLEASSHGVQVDRYEFRRLTGRTTDHATYPGFGYVTTPYIYDGSFYLAGGTAPAINTPGVLIPNGVNAFMKTDVRDRTGFAVTTQWENNDDTLLATFQFLRSDATLAWGENSIKSQMDFNTGTTYGYEGEKYEFDENGVFLSGSLAQVADGWRGEGDRVPHNASWGSADSRVNAFGHRFQTDNRYKEQNTVIDDFGFNLKWTPTDKLELTADLQHIKAKTKDDDVTLMFMTWAIMDVDLHGLPNVSVLNPWAYATPENLAYHATNGVGNFNFGDAQFQDRRSYLYNAAMDHYERSEGDSNAIRFDANYELDGFFTKVRAGVRMAEREQTVRFSAYNWDRLGPLWDGNGSWLNQNPLTGFDGDDAQLVDWSNFFRGDVISIPGGNKVLHPSDQLTRDYANWGSYFEGMYNVSDSDSCSSEWRPADQRTEWNGSSCVVRSDLNGLFRNDEINSTTELNQAAYVRFDFATELGSVATTGNIGVRYVRVTNETKGFTTYPTIDRSNLLPSNWDPQNVNPADYDLFDPNEANEFLGSENNFLSNDIINFANGTYLPNVAERTIDDVLPSFNIKFEVTENQVVRAAVSKALAYPDIGNLRNYVNIGTQQGSTFSFMAPYWNTANKHPLTPIDPNTSQLHVSGLPATVKSGSTCTSGTVQFACPASVAAAGNGPLFDSAGNPVFLGANGEPLNEQRIIDPDSINFMGWSGSSGNPLLKPMESIQFDLSWEWYFDQGGSLTTSYFYKDLSNFFINGSYQREFTNPLSGVTQTVDIAGPQNGGKGKMDGFEIAYQQFYDMLPSPFDGFGIQANYSYIRARGVPNSNLDNTDSIDDGITPNTSFSFAGDLPLQGQSDHTANFALMYEKYDWALRLAYNWRSEYLLTSRDVITGLPVFNDDQGYLDGSIFFNVNDNVKVGLQAVNLLNTETRTYSKVDANLKLPRTWFVDDTRYTFVVRANF